ncbi:MAG: radical SAM protein, partial [Gemmatimonadota bacterium]|nr:radical SAM protein [Gemmatimonadota bacterium]
MRIYLRTFGCRANHADSEVLRARLVAAGHEVQDDPAGADAAVFNSCAVTAQAEADLRQGVRAAARRAPALRSVVMGCVAGLDDRHAALRALPTVAEIVPGGDTDAVGRALGAALAPAPDGRQTGTRALLRIQDGCDEHCTFCATTLARGASRSRPEAALVREAAALAEHHPEIVLTGIHIGSYGADCGSSLGALLERLVRDVPGARFRLSSVEATEVDERLADLLAGGGDRVAPFLHAPLQSGSAPLLRRMGRHWYTPDEYAGRVECLTARRAVFGLGADVITGFPGETDDDHARTVALCERLPFTYLHVFPYSPRPGTAATRL